MKKIIYTKFICACAIFVLPNIASAAITSNLTIGSKGSQVTELQQILVQKGLLSSVTGYFGRATTAAVKELQKNNGLPVTGSVGPRTRSLLSSTTNSTNQVAKSTTESAQTKKPMGNYTELVSPTGFVNTGGQPITLGQYVGKKVILVSFITYSCINCQRTLPFMNDWYAKYKDKGLVVVGIHAPEFAYEKKIENVQKELGKLGVKFPVALDNNFDTWNAYKNQFWPHRYLIDLNGNVGYDHVGEGDYNGTETAIKKALGI